ncbi:MAG: hypothetical protein M1816_003887 [Peltula sp. TS41687]|nr:MAG: hypothetical protein M1816_003887 [Peltula sp. TS41687]
MFCNIKRIPARSLLVWDTAHHTDRQVKWLPLCCRRSLSSSTPPRQVPDFAFAFDIDGVLLRSSQPIPGAREALHLLQRKNVPFILLTNGGGKPETARVAELSDKLGLSLDIGMLIQSHTPFAGLATKEEPKAECILVVGGDGEKCRHVAEQYGFRNVITPGDLLMAHPSLWPFSHVFHAYYKSFARPLPRPIDPEDPSRSLKIGAIFVFHDPRDWALDTQVILDALLSSQGIMGTISANNDDATLPNRGFQQDGQPHIYFSNPDLWWAAQYHLPRLWQGAFREAFEGVWSAVTGGKEKGVELQKTMIGKPHQGTFEFAENRLNEHRRNLLRDDHAMTLKTVYFVGDNPESDIRGANEYQSPWGSRWHSILVRTGVFGGKQPDRAPTLIVNDVWEAVKWGLKQSGSMGAEQIHDWKDT